MVFLCQLYPHWPRQCQWSCVRFDRELCLVRLWLLNFFVSWLVIWICLALRFCILFYVSRDFIDLSVGAQAWLLNGRYSRGRFIQGWCHLLSTSKLNRSWVTRLCLRCCQLVCLLLLCALFWLCGLIWCPSWWLFLRTWPDCYKASHHDQSLVDCT